MGTYLLTWNPLWWEWTNLKNDIDEFDKQGYLEYNWSCGSTKKIVPGDRIFLIKIGKEPKGIMASGWATSKVYESGHWGEDNKSALYVDIRFDALLDPDQKIFPLSKLHKGIYAKTNWTPQSSGRTIPDDIAAHLEIDWANFLKSLSVNLSKQGVCMGKNYISKAYNENLAFLNQLNSDAYQFLKKLERHTPSMWLSTNKNAHLYINNKFLAYIKFTSDYSGIILSSRYNNKIWRGTEDHSASFFQKCLITTLEQYKDTDLWTSWLKNKDNSIEVTISKNAPEVFFHQLYNNILKIIKNNDSVKQRENNFEESDTQQSIQISKYWWFGINNIKTPDKASHHVTYSEIEKFLTGHEDEFFWIYGGSAYSKKFYSQMSVGDKIVLWMGHGWLEQWGILGFAYISDIHNIGGETKYCLKRLYIPENPLIPYPKNHPHETENTIFLRDTFSLNFYALKDVFYQTKYVDKRTTPVTVDEITSLQYSALWNRLSKQPDPKSDCEILLSELIYQIDVRKPPNGLRRERFKTGWEDATIREKNYSEEALKRLTWQNLGYRMGKRFGEKLSDDIFFVYEQFSDHYNRKIKEPSVEHLLRFLISDEDKRKNYLQIFTEVIKYANACGKNKWGVHCREDRVRLLLGNIIVFTFEKECIWLALDKNLVDQHANTLNLLEQSGFWKWDEKDYPIYRQVLSRNGYYLAPDTDVWSEIKHLHLEFVKKVAYKFSQLNKRSQMYHSSELLRYIGKELNESIPEPIYEEEDADISVFPDEVPDDEEYYEGATQKVTVNIYERNPAARRKCIDHYGTECCICGFNFEKKYKDIGKGFTHVHHLKPLSEITERYELNPIQDLRPVCPNCHAMLHKRKPPYSIEELKQVIS